MRHHTDKLHQGWTEVDQDTFCVHCPGKTADTTLTITNNKRPQSKITDFPGSYLQGKILLIMNRSRLEKPTRKNRK